MLVKVNRLEAIMNSAVTCLKPPSILNFPKIFNYYPRLLPTIYFNYFMQIYLSIPIVIKIQYIWFHWRPIRCRKCTFLHPSSSTCQWCQISGGNLFTSNDKEEKTNEKKSLRIHLAPGHRLHAAISPNADRSQIVWFTTIKIARELLSKLLQNELYCSGVCVRVPVSCLSTLYSF